MNTVRVAESRAAIKVFSLKEAFTVDSAQETKLKLECSKLNEKGRNVMLTAGALYGHTAHLKDAYVEAIATVRAEQAVPGRCGYSDVSGQQSRL